MSSKEKAVEIIRNNPTFTREEILAELKASTGKGIRFATLTKVRNEEVGQYVPLRQVGRLRRAGFTPKEISDLITAKNSNSGLSQNHNFSHPAWAKMVQQRKSIISRLKADFSRAKKKPTIEDIDKEINKILQKRSIWDYLDDISPRKKKKQVDFDAHAAKTRQTKFERDLYKRRGR